MQILRIDLSNVQKLFFMQIIIYTSSDLSSHIQWAIKKGHQKNQSTFKKNDIFSQKKYEILEKWQNRPFLP